MECNFTSSIIIKHTKTISKIHPRFEQEHGEDFPEWKLYRDYVIIIHFFTRGSNLQRTEQTKIQNRETKNRPLCSPSS